MKKFESQALKTAGRQALEDRKFLIDALSEKSENRDKEDLMKMDYVNAKLTTWRYECGYIKVLPYYYGGYYNQKIFIPNIFLDVYKEFENERELIKYLIDFEADIYLKAVVLFNQVPNVSMSKWHLREGHHQKLKYELDVAIFSDDNKYVKNISPTYDLIIEKALPNQKLSSTEEWMKDLEEK